MPLNAIQRVMAHHHDGPALFTAVAGSGKSTGICHNLEQKARQGYDLHKVIVTTFNKDAAMELRSRVASFYGAYLHHAPIGTSHSLFFRMLREQNYSFREVLTEMEAKIAVKKFLKKALEKKYKAGMDAEYLSAISYMKNHLCYPKKARKADVYNRYLAMRHFPASLAMPEDLFQDTWLHYEDTKVAAQKIDHDDMLLLCYVMFNNEPDILQFYQHKFSHLIVDEYQDTNEAQYQLFKALAAKHMNFMAVGDDDQAIYGFRGSKPAYIRRFKEDYPSAVHGTLEENYRCQAGVANAANILIAWNTDRYKKTIQPVKAFKVKPFVVECEDIMSEANFIADCVQGASAKLDDIACLTRTNGQQCWLEEVFLDRDIPYQVVEATPFYHRKEIQALLNYIEIARSGGERIDLIRDIANKPFRMMSGDIPNSWNRMDDLLHCWQGQKLHAELEYLIHMYNAGNTLQQMIAAIVDMPIMLGSWAKEQASLQSESNAYNNLVNMQAISANHTFESLQEKIKRVDEILVRNQKLVEKVAISTIHRAKGLEWEEVYIPGCNQNMMPHESSEDLEEERRLMYVAITRAKHYLTISYIRENDEGESLEPSQFLEEMADTLEYDVTTTGVPT